MINGRQRVSRLRSDWNHFASPKMTAREERNQPLNRHHHEMYRFHIMSVFLLASDGNSLSPRPPPLLRDRVIHLTY
jgi:hypothetical protein